MSKVRNLLFKDHDPYKDLELRGLDMQGWSSTDAVFKKIIDQVKPSLIIEVGSWKGASAIHMASLAKEHNPDVEIVCVDTWLGSVEHWDKFANDLKLKNGRLNIYEQFLSNIVHKELQDTITPFPIDSSNAYEWFKNKSIKADLIYIDAGHEYAAVRADLIAYSQILKDGGYLLGDDFKHEPVKVAAYDTFTKDLVIDYGSKFLWIK